MEAIVKQPHEARVQRYAYAALVAASLLAAWDASASNGKVFGLAVPLAASLGLVGLGAVAGIIAAARRSASIAVASVVLLLLGVAPGGNLEPGFVGYARGFAFGGLALAFLELVHMTQRYDRAHKLVEEEGASEESLDRVTDEALKTLGGRTLLALGIAFSAVVVALGLAAFGPTSWREGVETSSPLGIAVLAIGILVALSLFILTRGAKLRAEATPQEVAADVTE